MKLSISVALCTYNGEDFLSEQLESIYNQEMPIDEIVICDDNSNDKSLEIIYQFKERHQELNIRVYKNDTNLGVIRNFEKAIKACSGDIIFCSDQDDIWTKEKTKTIISWFNSHPETELVFTNAVLIDKNGQLLCESTLFDKIQFTPQARKLWKYGLALELTNIRNRITGATMAFRKSVVTHVLPFVKNTHYLHDEQIAITCVKRNTAHMMDICLTKYRIHNNNTIGINQNGDKLTPRLYDPFEVRQAMDLIYDNDIEVGKRIEFLKERNKNNKSFKGRLKALFSFIKYIKYYKRFFIFFYLTDLTLGLNDFINDKYKKILDRISHCNITFRLFQ